MKKKQCQAFVSSTQNQCRRNIRFSRYCWQHQSKLPWLATAVAGWALGQALSWAWNWVAPSTSSRSLQAIEDAVSRRPSFRVYLNDVVISSPDQEKAAIVIQQDVANLRFAIRNVGSTAAVDFSACITFPKKSAIAIPGAWSTQPDPDGFDGDKVVSGADFAHYRIQGNDLVARGDALSLPPFALQNPQPMARPVPRSSCMKSS